MLTAIVWKSNLTSVKHQKPKPITKRIPEANVPELLDKLDAMMSLQIQFMELVEESIKSRRFQLLWIIFQACAVIVFNVYHLLMFSMRLLMQHQANNLNIIEALIFYGYPIISECIKLILTIVCISSVKQSFHEMLTLLNKFNIYAQDSSLRRRLFELSSNLRCNLENYTVYGLYALNGSLLSSICANTITYIVILMQYSMGDIYPTTTTTRTSTKTQ